MATADDTRLRRPPATPVARLLVPFGTAVTGLALVVGVLGALVAWPLAVLLFLAVEGAAWGGFVAPRLRTAEARALAAIGSTRPADGSRGTGEARVLNLLDGLSPTAGVARPRCLVLEADARNAAAVGLDDRRAAVVLTTGLLAAASRVELEALAANLLVRIRDGATGPATVALAVPVGRHRAAGPSAAEADVSAVTLTRYPPAMASALRLLGPSPQLPAGASPQTAPLWLAWPGDEGALAARLETIEEL